MLPPWDSLAELQGYQDWLTRTTIWAGVIWGVIFAVCAGLFGLFRYNLSNRIDELKQAEMIENPTIKIARAGTRAYLSASPEIGDFEVGKPIDWAVRYRNDGNVPAQILEKSIGIVVCPAEAELNELGNKDIERIKSLPVKWSVTRNEELRLVDEQPPIMTLELLDNIADGKLKLYATSKIWYRDGISDELRTIIVCFDWIPTSNELRLNEKLSYRD